MIEVKLTRDLPIMFEMTGHAHFADAGTDIVCAAASSITITSFNAMAKFLEKLDYEVIEQDRYLSVMIKKSNKEVGLLLDNLMETLTELEKQFPKNIKIIK